MKGVKKRIEVVLIMAVVLSTFAVLMSGRPAAAKTIKLNSKTVYMAPGDTYQLKVVNTKKKVVWKSSNKKVVTVSGKGRLKAKKTGKATITARVKGKKLKCKVIVEKKSINRARKLRNYVLSKGKYEKTSNAYVISWEYLDSDCNTSKAEISAFKGKNKLEFYYQYRPDAPSSVTSVTLKINLISGTASVRQGKASSNYRYEDDWDNETYYADITTNFDGNAKGFTLTKMTWEENNYDEETGMEDTRFMQSVDASELSKHVNTMNYRMNSAFKFWNRLFSKRSALKKAGVTMKSIGFGRWNK